MEELKPCPFCGNKADYDNEEFAGGDGYRSWSGCTVCSAKTRTKEEWNNRATEINQAP